MIHAYDTSQSTENLILKMSNESLIKGLVGSLLKDSRRLPVITGQSRILVNVIQGSMIFLVMRRRVVIAALG